MSVTKSIAAAVTVTLIGTGAFAEMPIYPYPTKENYCPAGLQPITMNGVICCGTPNTDRTYQSVMAHPTPKKVHKVQRTHKVTHSRVCPEGQKGCY